MTRRKKRDLVGNILLPTLAIVLYSLMSRWVNMKVMTVGATLWGSRVLARN